MHVVPEREMLADAGLSELAMLAQLSCLPLLSVPITVRHPNMPRNADRSDRRRREGGNKQRGEC